MSPGCESQISYAVKAFMDTIENAGYKPMLYGNKEWLIRRLLDRLLLTHRLRKEIKADFQPCIRGALDIVKKILIQHKLSWSVSLP